MIVTRPKKKNKKSRSANNFIKGKRGRQNPNIWDDEEDWLSGSFTVLDDGFDNDIINSHNDDEDDSDEWDADDYLLMADDDESDEDY